MDQLQLKVTPHRAALIADAIDRDIAATGDYRDTRELAEVRTWLRYRLERWLQSHPDQPPS